jgi:excisionase family DNA binding protein
MEKTYMNRPEVAEYLGVSIRFVDNMIKDKKIPCARLGKRVIFSVPSINKWLDDNEVKVCEPITEEN